MDYHLTPTLLKTITEIERLYGKLEGMQIPKNLLLNLERNNLIQSSFSSNSIEGNPLTHMEVTNLLLNDRVAVNRDEKEVTNYFNILKKLPDMAKTEFGIDTLLEIHKQLLQGVADEMRGKIRNKSVVIGYYTKDNQIVVKHTPPTHKKQEIIGYLQKLVKWLKESDAPAVIKAGLYHHQLVYIHPFEDGNGRVCRLTTALILLKERYKINKYFILDDYYDIDRETYSNKLHTADSGDKTEWLEYFTEGIKYSLQSAISRIGAGLDELRIDLRPTPREKQVLEIVKEAKEITSSYLVGNLGISRQQAFNLLRGLTEKGYLNKKGTTKNSYYELL